MIGMRALKVIAATGMVVLGLSVTGVEAAAAVLENKHLALTPEGDGVVLRVKGGAAGGAGAVTLILAGADGKPLSGQAKLGSASRSPQGLSAELTVGGARATLLLKTDEPVVEVLPAGKACAGVSFKAVLAFRPDLFDTDILYQPDMAAFAGGSADLVVENYIVNVLSQDAAAMLVWSDVDAVLSLSAAGKGADRRFTGAVLRSGKLVVAMLNRPQMFRHQNLAGMEYKGKRTYKDRGTKKVVEIKVASHDYAWKIPFPARWYTMIHYAVHADDKGAFAPVTKQWPLQAQLKGKLSWRKPGKLYDPDMSTWGSGVVKRHSTFNGRDKWHLAIEDRWAPGGYAVNYPLARLGDTPADVVVLTDVLVSALGEAEAGKVLDLEGAREISGFGKDVGDKLIACAYEKDEKSQQPLIPTASCWSMSHLLKSVSTNKPPAKSEEEMKKLIKGWRALAATIGDYFVVVSGRSRGYVKMVDDLAAFSDAQASKSADVKALGERLKKISQEIKAHLTTGPSYRHPLLSAEGHKGLWDKVDGILASMDPKVWDEKKYGALRGCKNTQVLRGDCLDSYLSRCYKVVKRLNDIAVLEGGKTPATLAFARAYRKKLHAAIRNHHHMGNKYISTNGPVLKPARRAAK